MAELEMTRKKTYDTWNMFWYNNLLFSKCENHNTIITPNHIKNIHNITNPPNLSAILYEDYIIQLFNSNSSYF